MNSSAINPNLCRVFSDETTLLGFANLRASKNKMLLNILMKSTWQT